MVSRRVPVPFYQALSAITGAGKTPILAEAVAQMSALLPQKPLVLWIAKAKVVVDQTYANFTAGGKYASFLKDFVVTYLAKLTAEQIKDGAAPVVALATVGSFNQKGKADGSLRVHRGAEDTTEVSLWEALRLRETSDETRRPLVIVYDEGHNLSDQQTELLLELEPDAVLVASATMRIPVRLGRVIDRFKDAGHADSDLVTVVPTAPIVERGLVKQQVVLGGYDTSMEAVLGELLEGWRNGTRQALSANAGFLPKAIYVCRTNVRQDDGTLDSAAQAFRDRKAPPILIWRHLVEKQMIDPKTIAVYADLKIDRKNFPPPADFVLFSGGEDDYAAFTKGDYTHVIFNQGLQEGWDDPACCFAYIDKSMGSPLQIEQVIGRVLRQPGARKYADPDLNTASFYIRIDSRQFFHQVLDRVRRKLAQESPEIRLDSYVTTGKSPRRKVDASETRYVPQVHIDSEDALESIDHLVEDIIDYRGDTAGNTRGKGVKLTATVKIGVKDTSATKTKTVSHSTAVMARWLMRRRMLSLYPDAAEAVDWSNAKFDAPVELTSPAARSLEASAEEIVRAYLTEANLVYEDCNPYEVGPVYVNDSKLVRFENALHEGYSDLNNPELAFATALDESGVKWSRNPSNGGYEIPLLEIGSRHFRPDFIAWSDRKTFLLDPKGGFILALDAGRKLLDIRSQTGVARVSIRLISEGKWSDPATRSSSQGFTVWTLRTGKPRPRHCRDLAETVRACLS